MAARNDSDYVGNFELVKNVGKKTFFILQMKTHIRDIHAEYWKFETSDGLFQIYATNVRNKTRVESDQPDKRFLVEKFFWWKIF